MSEEISFFLSTVFKYLSMMFEKSKERMDGFLKSSSVVKRYLFDDNTSPKHMGLCRLMHTPLHIHIQRELYILHFRSTSLLIL